MAVLNTEFIRFLGELEPRFRPLAVTLRYWATKCGRLSGGGGGKITNYAFTMLVIFFLQTRQPSILPSVKSMQSVSSRKFLFYITLLLIVHSSGS